MQQRLIVSHHTSFPLALDAKEDQQKRNPSNSYQIRKVETGFNLVIRLPVNKIKESPEKVVRTRRRR